MDLHDTLLKPKRSEEKWEAYQGVFAILRVSRVSLQGQRDPPPSRQSSHVSLGDLIVLDSRLILAPLGKLSELHLLLLLRCCALFQHVFHELQHLRDWSDPLGVGDPFFKGSLGGDS